MFRRKLPAAQHQREASLQPWADAGYDAAATERIIAMASTAFGLPESEARKLRPEDSVWGLYRHFYPRRSGWRGWLDEIRPDELEMETLLRDLQRVSPSVVAEDLGESISFGGLVHLLQSGRRA